MLPCLLDCHTACILKARGVLSNSSGYAQSFSFPWFGSFFQALENLFFPFKANWEKGKVKVAHSCLTCFDPWTIQFTEFSRPEYWSGLSLLQGIFPTQGSNPGPALQADSLPSEPPLILNQTPLFSSIQFSRSVMSDSLRPHESQHARSPCPSPTPGVHSDSRPSSQ